jgi:hypothetical protein
VCWHPLFYGWVIFFPEWGDEWLNPWDMDIKGGFYYILTGIRHVSNSSIELIA